jgi:hypothetical protein
MPTIGGGAVQGLDLGLLIDTEDHGVGGRIDIQSSMAQRHLRAVWV